MFVYVGILIALELSLSVNVFLQNWYPLGAEMYLSHAHKMGLGTVSKASFCNMHFLNYGKTLF